LNQLNSFSVNKLKIDKSFVCQIDGEKNNSIIASTIMALGKNLNLEITAEGVETQEQANFFKETTCDECKVTFLEDL
jgi:EAL domain-containing protein (putative c-di-GMP-specific phosphodiesterase class I)